MNISQASNEFRIRRYLWAKVKAAEEVAESFPHFWLFKGETTWKCYQFLKGLSRSDQQVFVSARLKRWHRAAAAPLGESISAEEQALDDRYRAFHLLPSPLEREIAARRRMGERVTFASKRKVQRASVSSFQRAFGGMGLESTQVAGYPAPFLRMRFGGWVVQTNLLFGHGRSALSYDHLIASEERIFHPTTPGVTAPALILDCLICWIGLGRMEWDFLTDEDIEPACDSVTGLCREFFNELPALLRGLERERVSPD